MVKSDKYIEEELEGLLSAIENTDICTFWYFPQEKMITMDERTARMYSCKRKYADMPESFAEDFVHLSTRTDFFEMYRRIDAGEKTAQASFSSLDRKNWCTVTLTTVSYDKEGRPRKSLGIVQNISEIKLQAAEYHSRSRTLSSIISALSKIYMFNYYIDLESGEYKEIVSPDYISEALGKEGIAACALERFADTLIEDNYKEEFRRFVDLGTVAERIGKQQNISLEYFSIRKGWCRASFIVVNRNKAGVPVQIEFVVENISAEREKELEAREALERAYEAANRANASKSAFLNNMSHDIRTPMNAIVGFAAIAASHIEEKERVQDCITKITASSKHLLSIINEVLDMSRIESGKMRIQEQEVVFPAILHDFMNMIQGQIKAKGLELCIRTVDLLHEHVYADEARLHRVLLNLVGNAVKFTPSGGRISICLTEKPQTSSQKGNYVISVQDTGIGMSKEFLPHVFEPFEREQTSTVSKVEGTGLGMPITKNIIGMMGGSIYADSEQGKGTTFTIELSLRLVEKEMDNPRIENLAGLHAMIINDDYNVCDNAARMLDKIGMEPEWAMTGKEAVLRVKSAREIGRKFSVYIVDWKLPDISGIEVVRELQEISAEEDPIYILTAYDFSDIEGEARRAGVTSLCQKPLFLSQIRNTLLKAAGEEKEKEKLSGEPQKELRGKKILLAEDNELNREIAEDILTEAGFIVDTVNDGKAAVDRIADVGEGEYDLILMDIQMPVMDGYEASGVIRAMSDGWMKRLPILAMTANAFEEDKRKALEAGMDGHLAKPVDIQSLFETLYEILKE